MLRIIVAVLLGINLVFGAYHWGWLAQLGWGEAPVSHAPADEEVAPERIVIVPPAALQPPVSPAEAEGDTPPLNDAAATAVVRVCRALDDLTPEVHAQVEQTLQTLLQDSSRWSHTEALINGRWIVYIGKLSEEQLQARRAQLRAANIEHRVVTTPRLAPGLALGTYSAPERARNALQTARSHGVRDARVEQERAPTRAFSLQIKDLTPNELTALEASEALTGKTLQPCP
jgi:hypothetical protein